MQREYQFWVHCDHYDGLISLSLSLSLFFKSYFASQIHSQAGFFHDYNGDTTKWCFPLFSSASHPWGRGSTVVPNVPRQRLGPRLQAPAWVTCPPLTWAPRLGTDRRWWASSSPFQGLESIFPQSPLMLSGRGERVQMLERWSSHLYYRSM